MNNTALLRKEPAKNDIAKTSQKYTYMAQQSAAWLVHRLCTLTFGAMNAISKGLRNPANVAIVLVKPNRNPANGPAMFGWER